MLHPCLIRQQGLMDITLVHKHSSFTVTLNFFFFVFPPGSMNVSVTKEEVKRRKAPCRSALVSADHNHSELEEERRLAGPRWREGSRENTFDHTRVLKTSPTAREITTRKSAVLLGKVLAMFCWISLVNYLQTRL